jgi:hypothetical protein
MNPHDVALAVAFNDKVRLKLPKKRLYRTNSIANELRKLGKPFEWFTKNSISLEIPKRFRNEQKRTLFITGSLNCYKIRIDVWYYTNQGDFQYIELPCSTGHSLLFELVKITALDPSYLPAPVKVFYEPHGHDGL